MTRSAIAVGAALLATVVAGCGSSGQSATPTASVESATDAGAPASGDECPANSPLRGILKGYLQADDGVFGHIYNNTDGTLWLWSQRKDDKSPCRLEPGKGASFGAAQEGIDSNKLSPWIPDPDWVRIWILMTTSPDTSAPGVAVGLSDPPDWRSANASSVYRTAAGGRCTRDDVQLKTGGLSEDQEYRLKGSSQGSVLVKRLPDNKEIAREWTDTSAADDWARIDLYVESIGSC